MDNAKGFTFEDKCTDKFYFLINNAFVPNSEKLTIDNSNSAK